MNLADKDINVKMIFEDIFPIASGFTPVRTNSRGSAPAFLAGIQWELQVESS